MMMIKMGVDGLSEAVRIASDAGSLDRIAAR